MSSPVVVWFRNDLRLRDHEALAAAAASDRAVIPLYVHDDQPAGGLAPGARSRWWLHRSLEALDASLRERGSRLIVAQGEPARAIADVVRASGATAVHCHRQHGPGDLAAAERVAAALRELGVAIVEHRSTLLVEPEALASKAGTPFRVFSAFHRAHRLHAVGAPLPAPEVIAAPAQWPPSVDLGVLGVSAHWPLSVDRGVVGMTADSPLSVEPEATGTFAHGEDTGVPVAGGSTRLKAAASEQRTPWRPGERGAHRALEEFIDEHLRGYAVDRDHPSRDATSRLSPHLRFGEISPREIVARIAQARRADAPAVGPDEPADDARAATQRAEGLASGPEAFLREITWREFAHHVLAHAPSMLDTSLDMRFERLEWTASEEEIEAWQAGRTGYPIVDAGMRELLATGRMHNRVRMITASFLVKDLLAPWQRGAAWFWETLVDADTANNAMNWQWVAGCGSEASPFFRIFNPVAQAERFDPDGAYVRRWVPPLAALPGALIHRPWDASPLELAAAGVELGRDYPHRIVDHAQARQRALDAYRRMKSGA